MFSHITVGSSNMERSMAFYDAVMPAIGHGRLPLRNDNFVGYGLGGERVLPWLSFCKPYDGKSATCGNGFHIAWVAPNEASVNAFHAAAMANGGTDEGAPGDRPLYRSDYYAAYVRDPDGNKLQAVHYQDGRVMGAGGKVLSHVTLPFVDIKLGLAFYEPVFATIGVTRRELEESPGEDYAFSKGSVQLPVAYVQRPFDGKLPAPGNGQHTAFMAESRAQVDAFYETAMRLGGTDEGKPGLRPEYTADYYGAYVRDPSGTKIQAVHRNE